jgi:hypothetical protein
VTRLTILAMALVLLFAAGAAPQNAPQPGIIPPKSASDGTNVPLRIQVVIARYRGEKRISSLPYTLFTQIQNRDRSVAQLRMGADIPVSTMPPRPTEGTAEPPGPRISYDRVGTEIDCVARPSLDGRYVVALTISDRTVYSEDETPRLTATSSIPTLRSFRAHNEFVLRDGQSTQFAAAADRITGEVVRIEVTLESLK